MNFWNPLGREVKHIHKIPKVGDKVIITDFGSQADVKESTRVARIDRLTISEVNPRMESDDDNYYWVYDICVEETPLEFMHHEYKVIK